MVRSGEVVRYLCTGHLIIIMLVISVIQYYNTIRHYYTNTMDMTHISIGVSTCPFVSKYYSELKIVQNINLLIPTVYVMQRHV